MQKYILITGASSGIGRDLAIRLSEKYDLVLHGTSRQKLEEVQSKCSEQCKKILWTCDFSALENVAAEFSSLLNNQDMHISGYVHSAGIGLLSPLKSIKTVEYKKVFNVNVFAALEIVRVLALQKREKRVDSIVMISSIAGHKGVKGQSIYCASKGAINSMIKSMADEIAPLSRINAVLPGLLETPMNKSYFADESNRKIAEENYPLGIGNSQHIVGTVEFLLSEKSRWITGQEFVVDGGVSLK